ncbi:hypothetical protein SBADM41S_07041 [Streptomyces badius]
MPLASPPSPAGVNAVYCVSARSELLGAGRPTGPLHRQQSGGLRGGFAGAPGAVTVANPVTAARTAAPAIREALGPAVDGLAGQRLAVQRGRPPRVGGIRDPQHAARLAGRDLRVGLDGGRADRDVLALAGGRGDHDPGDLAVDAPQRAAVELAEAAEARGRVEDPAHLARCPVPDEDVADREAAELAALVGAGPATRLATTLSRWLLLPPASVSSPSPSRAPEPRTRL